MLKEFESAKEVGQTDLDGWMNAPCKIMGTHKVRAPWWTEKGEVGCCDKQN